MDYTFNFFFTILNEFGWLGNWLFLFIATAECVPFIGGLFPGGTLIYIGGILAAQGYFSIIDIIIFAAIGSIIGDYCGYLLGRHGVDWLKNKKIIKPEVIASSTAFFNKYGDKSVLWGRFIGPMRAIIPFVAGASQMKHRSFLLWNIISAIIWAITDPLLGYFSGNILAIIIRRWSHRLGFILLALAAIGLIYWIIKHHGRNLRQNLRQETLELNRKVLSLPRVQHFQEHHPVAAELAHTKTGQERLIWIFLGTAILISLYLLTLIVDLL